MGKRRGAAPIYTANARAWRKAKLPVAKRNLASS
jgi:hypothetical protein